MTLNQIVIASTIQNRLSNLIIVCPLYTSTVDDIYNKPVNWSNLTFKSLLTVESERITIANQPRVSFPIRQISPRDGIKTFSRGMNKMVIAVLNQIYGRSIVFQKRNPPAFTDSAIPVYILPSTLPSGLYRRDVWTRLNVLSNLFFFKFHSEPKREGYLPCDNKFSPQMWHSADIF